jgi:Quinolinate synthetase A protein
MWVILRHIKNKEIASLADIFDEIATLKARENATILAHYYQEGDIQEIADFTGDSLKLARAASTVNTGTIVFCGVHFMAETAKMLNPTKRVLPRPAARPFSGKTLRGWPAVSDRHVHQQHRGGQGALRLGRDVRQRRGDHSPRAGGDGDSFRSGSPPRPIS